MAIKRGLAATALIGLLAAPWWAGDFFLRLLTGALMWIGLAQSWNVMGGYAGYLNFGHGAFFGIGAYATALLMGAGWPFFATLPVGVALSATLAGLIGLPTLRLRGAYFAIATWAFGEMLKQAALILSFTGGAYGLQVRPLLDEPFFFYAMFGATALTLLTTHWALHRSHFGYQLRAIRDHELAAEMVGIDTTWVKLRALLLSSLYPPVLGGIFAYWITFIHPQSVLDSVLTDQMVVMTLLGGIGTVAGPIVGGGALWLINRLLWAYLGDSVVYLIVLGLTVCLVVLYLPDGLVGLYERWRPGAARIRAAQETPAREEGAA